ncbi:MAG: phenylalanine--tRNA ligase subunit beta, partial [Firmicutes bacterium]|nr:phenylalanine--tRNA ligase subunit beta [Bacillota bacterium]
IQPLPRFPAVERDIAMIVADTVPYAEVATTIRQAGGALLERMALFDVYRGPQVPEQHRSLAFSLTFRAPDRTLSDEEVDTAMTSIEQEVVRRYNARIRGR